MYNEGRPDYMIRKYLNKVMKISRSQCPGGEVGGVCKSPLGCIYCNLTIDIMNRLREFPRGESNWKGEDVA